MYNAQNADDMVECPYNKAHRMLRKRLQSHLLKCRLSYPDVELQKCPFNQTHLVPEPEFVHHVTNCSDRKLITQYKYDAPALEKEEERVKHEPIQCDENWDDMEAEDYDPKKYVEKAKVLRKIDGGQPSERKAIVKQERKRLGDYDSEDEEEDKAKMKKCDVDRPHSSNEEKDSIFTALKSAAPPAPRNMSWIEEDDGNAYRGNPEIMPNRYRPRNPHENLYSRNRVEQGPSRQTANKNHRGSAYALDDDPYYNGNVFSNAVPREYGFFERSGYPSGRGAYRGRPNSSTTDGFYQKPFYQL